MPIPGDERDYGLIQRGTQPEDNIDGIPSYILGRTLMDAADYVSQISIVLHSMIMGAGINVPPDKRFKLSKFSVSSFDIFV